MGGLDLNSKLAEKIFIFPKQCCKKVFTWKYTGYYYVRVQHSTFSSFIIALAQEKMRMTVKLTFSYIRYTAILRIWIFREDLYFTLLHDYMTTALCGIECSFLLCYYYYEYNMKLEYCTWTWMNGYTPKWSPRTISVAQLQYKCPKIAMEKRAICVAFSQLWVYSMTAFLIAFPHFQNNLKHFENYIIFSPLCRILKDIINLCMNSCDWFQ